MINHHSVLEYWLADAAKSAEHANQQKKLWYRSSKAIDDEIREQFADLHAEATNGNLNSWREEPESTLALVIILDQFSRHLYRSEPSAFAQDNLALEIAQNCPKPESLPFIGQVFLLHPFEHSERLDIQEQSVVKFQHLANRADTEWKPLMRNFRDHAIEHHNIVARFGRFPHRNAILGRESSEEELQFLQDSGKTFGQNSRSPA